MKKKWALRILTVLLAAVVIAFANRATDIIKNAEVFKYNEDGNITYRKWYGGRETYTYEDGLLVKMTNRRHDGSVFRVFLYEYDANGNKVLEREDTTGRFITYRYDDANRLIEMNDTEKGTTTYSYNEAGQKTRCVMPDGTEITYDYDGSGNMTTEKWSTGNVVRWEYYENGMKKSKSSDSERYEWKYFDDEPEKISWGKMNDVELTYDRDGNAFIFKRPYGTTTYKYITRYRYWKNGGVKTKRVYEIWQRSEPTKNK